MWTLREFITRVAPLAPRYRMDNAWFSAWGNDDICVLNAWRMYKCSSQNGLGFLLLGDTKIRKDPALMMNFGLASAHGVQEEAELKVIEEAFAERRRFATAASGPAVPVLGPGSILSDRNWSPLLNDAFVMGGIHSGQDFHLAEEQFNPFVEAGGAAGPKSDDYRQIWNAFLLHHPDVLWKGGFPRVFARELIGLKTFGYAPVFSPVELGFCCRDPSAAHTADFAHYLEALSAVGLHRNDRATVLATVAEFLFADRDALSERHLVA